MRASTITSKGQIVIPSEMRSKPGFKSGQRVAVMEFEDYLEVRPLKDVLSKIDFEAERQKTRKALRKFIKKHNLKGKKIREITQEERDELAREYLR